MRNKDRALLLQQAAALITLGQVVEQAQQNLEKLKSWGVPDNAPEMTEALQYWQRLDLEWRQLEAEHLALSTKLMD